MAKRFIITPISEDGTVGRAIYVHKKSKIEGFIETVGAIMVTCIFFYIVLFIVRAAIEVYW
jgi:hypothetical protein